MARSAAPVNLEAHSAAKGGGVHNLWPRACWLVALMAAACRQCSARSTGQRFCSYQAAEHRLPVGMCWAGQPVHSAPPFLGTKLPTAPLATLTGSLAASGHRGGSYRRCFCRDEATGPLHTKAEAGIRHQLGRRLVLPVSEQTEVCRYLHACCEPCICAGAAVPTKKHCTPPLAACMGQGSEHRPRPAPAIAQV